MIRNEAGFIVGDVRVYGDIVLAPMAGYSDLPHRALCREYGSAMNYTEFVSVEEISAGSKRAWSLLDRAADDRPMVFQIFGNNARLILEASLRIEGLGPDIIDVNMGCSTRRVSGRGAGVGMMSQPDLIAETFDLLSKHLSVPVTGKLRLGWDDQRNYIDVARIMEDNGAALVAIHPRTKEQKYGGQADWDAIARLKQSVSIPVIGNGDICCARDIDRMLDHTGCDGVMIGRGAIGNPWIFAREDRRQHTFNEIARVIRQHLGSMLVYYGQRGLILFRKYLKHYLANTSNSESYYQQMVTADNSSEFHDLLIKMEEAHAQLQRSRDTSQPVF